MCLAACSCFIPRLVWDACTQRWRLDAAALGSGVDRRFAPGSRARAVTIRDLRAAAEALEDLPETTPEAMERLQRLCVARGVS